ncbi:MAG: hypothetical protein AAGJ35_10935 [Myxococcota bacterium]
MTASSFRNRTRSLKSRLRAKRYFTWLWQTNISQSVRDPEFEALPHELKCQVNELTLLLQRDPEYALPQLELLCRRFPHVPQLYNAIASGYGMIGDIPMQQSWLKRMYALFPHYMFAICAYGEMLLREEKLDEFQRMFLQHLVLDNAFPPRPSYHPSEVICFFRMWCRYFIALGELRIAYRYYVLLCEVDPHHPQVQPLHQLFGVEVLEA